MYQGDCHTLFTTNARLPKRNLCEIFSNSLRDRIFLALAWPNIRFAAHSCAYVCCKSIHLLSKYVQRSVVVVALLPRR